jgi:hypothetical protein
MTSAYAAPPNGGRPPKPGMSAVSRGVKRQVNDLMRDGLGSRGDFEPIAFFCECSDESCYQAVWLSGPDYERACEDPDWVALVTGHASHATSAA